MSLAISLLTQDSGATHNFTTASISPASGGVVYLWVVQARPSGFPDDVPAVSGNGLTWTQLATGVYASRRRWFLYRGDGTPSTGTISFSNSSTSDVNESRWHVIQVTGQDSTTPNGTIFTNSVSATSVAVTITDSIDTGDGVLAFFAKEAATGAVTLEGSLTSLGSQASAGTNVRWSVAGYDTTSPIDSTPSASWSPSAPAVGVAFVVNVGSGGGPITHDTSGALIGQSSVIVGSASSATERTSSGALVGGGAQIAGTAARTREHSTSGGLSGQGSVIVGSAARTRQHETSGILSAGQATLSGSANRTRVFSTSGALIGQGSIINGSAERIGSATSHDTSGALVGQNAIVVGSAARVAAPVTHDTAGVLTGQGSIINGVASGSGFVDTHDGFWAKQWKKAAEREKKKAEKIEQIYENLQEIEEQLEEVKEKPAKTIKVNRNTLTLPPIDAKIQLIEKLIIQRQKILQQIEEEELLLL